jgi:site-specific DNA-methyltransferase (adenine-specific)
MTDVPQNIAESGEVIKLDQNKDYDYSGFHFTKTSLEPLSDNISFDTWERCGEWIKRANGAVHFWLGDWLNYGEKHYGETYSQAIENTGFDYGTLANDKYVAGKVESSRRRENLSFAHHQDVADLKPEQQKELLDLAEKEDIKSKEFRKIKQKFIADSKRLPPPIVIDSNLICGDAVEELKKLDDASIDCVVTDPPYGIDYQSNRRTATEKLDKIANDNSDAFTLLSNVCEVLQKKVKPDSHLYFFTSWKVYSEFETVISDYFDIKNLIVWDKLNHGTGDLDGNYAEQHELIIFATTGRRILNGPRPINIIAYPKAVELEHPNEKPVGLMERLIAVSTNVGELVCDPFMGTGSVCIAAKKLDRKYIGIDLGQNYVNISQRRINEI